MPLQVLAEKTRQALGVDAPTFQAISLERYQQALGDCERFSLWLNGYHKHVRALEANLQEFFRSTDNAVRSCPLPSLYSERYDTRELRPLPAPTAPQIYSHLFSLPDAAQSTAAVSGSGAQRGPDFVELLQLLPSSFHDKFDSQVLLPIEMWLQAYREAKLRLSALDRLRLKVDAQRRKLERQGRHFMKLHQRQQQQLRDKRRSGSTSARSSFEGLPQGLATTTQAALSTTDGPTDDVKVAAAVGDLPVVVVASTGRSPSPVQGTAASSRTVRVATADAARATGPHATISGAAESSSAAAASDLSSDAAAPESGSSTTGGVVLTRLESFPLANVPSSIADTDSRRSSWELQRGAEAPASNTPRFTTHMAAPAAGFAAPGAVPVAAAAAAPAVSSKTGTGRADAGAGAGTSRSGGGGAVAAAAAARDAFRQGDTGRAGAGVNGRGGPEARARRESGTTNSSRDDSSPPSSGDEEDWAAAVYHKKGEQGLLQAHELVERKLQPLLSDFSRAEMQLSTLLGWLVTQAARLRAYFNHMMLSSAFAVDDWSLPPGLLEPFPVDIVLGEGAADATSSGPSAALAATVAASADAPAGPQEPQHLPSLGADFVRPHAADDTDTTTMTDKPQRTMTTSRGSSSTAAAEPVATSAPKGVDHPALAAAAGASAVLAAKREADRHKGQVALTTSERSGLAPSTGADGSIRHLQEGQRSALSSHEQPTSAPAAVAEAASRHAKSGLIDPNGGGSSAFQARDPITVSAPAGMPLGEGVHVSTPTKSGNHPTELTDIEPPAPTTTTAAAATPTTGVAAGAPAIQTGPAAGNTAAATEHVITTVPSRPVSQGLVAPAGDPVTLQEADLPATPAATHPTAAPAPTTRAAVAAASAQAPVTRGMEPAAGQPAAAAPALAGPETPIAGPSVVSSDAALSYLTQDKALIESLSAEEVCESPARAGGDLLTSTRALPATPGSRPQSATAEATRAPVGAAALAATAAASTVAASRRGKADIIGAEVPIGGPATELQPRAIQASTIEPRIPSTAAPAAAPTAAGAGASAGPAAAVDTALRAGQLPAALEKKEQLLHRAASLESEAAHHSAAAAEAANIATASAAYAARVEAQLQQGGLKTERSRLLSRQEAISFELSQLETSQLVNLREAAANIHRQLAELQLQQESLQSQEREAVAHHAELEESRSVLSMRAKELEEMVARVKDTVTRSEAEVSSQTEAARLAETEVLQAASRVSEAEAEREAALQLMALARTEIDAGSKELSDLSRERSTHLTEMRSLEDERLPELTRHLAALQARLRLLQHQRRPEAEAALAAAQQEQQQAEQQIERWQKVSSSASTSLSELAAEMNSLSCAAAAAAAKAASARGLQRAEEARASAAAAEAEGLKAAAQSLVEVETQVEAAMAAAAAAAHPRPTPAAGEASLKLRDTKVAAQPEASRRLMDSSSSFSSEARPPAPTKEYVREFAPPAPSPAAEARAAPAVPPAELPVAPVAAEAAAVTPAAAEAVAAETAVVPGAEKVAAVAPPAAVETAAAPAAETAVVREAERVAAVEPPAAASAVQRQEEQQAQPPQPPQQQYQRRRVSMESATGSVATTASGAAPVASERRRSIGQSISRLFSRRKGSPERQAVRRVSEDRFRPLEHSFTEAPARTLQLPAAADRAPAGPSALSPVAAQLPPTPPTTTLAAAASGPMAAQGGAGTAAGGAVVQARGRPRRSRRHRREQETAAALAGGQQVMHVPGPLEAGGDEWDDQQVGRYGLRGAY